MKKMVHQTETNHSASICAKIQLNCLNATLRIVVTVLQNILREKRVYSFTMSLFESVYNYH